MSNPLTEIFKTTIRQEIIDPPGKSLIIQRIKSFLNKSDIQAHDFLHECKFNLDFFCKEVLGDKGFPELEGLSIWSAQEEIAKALLTSNRIAIKSGNGVGKTRILSRIALQYLFCYGPCKVITTAPTNRQVEKLLWSEIRAGYSNSRIKFGICLNKEFQVAPNWFAFGFSTNDEVSFQGYHSKNVLVIFDEASGVEKIIYTGAEGLLTGQDSKIILIGNPNLNVGNFYDAFKSSDYKHITINSEQSPNVIHDKEIIPGLVSKKWIEDKKKQWGKDSDLYRVKVLGEFPTKSEDSLLGINDIDLLYDVKKEGIEKHIGVDIARGGDKTMVYLREGNFVYKRLSWNDADLNIISGRIKELAQSEGIESSNIHIDSTGLGIGVVDILAAENFFVDPVQFAERQTSACYGAEIFGEGLKFKNRRAEILWYLTENIKRGRVGIFGKIDNLIEELLILKLIPNPKGLVEMIQKKEIKKIINRSPDDSDAMALCFCSGSFMASGYI